MKNIKNYDPEKYVAPEFIEVEPGIYKSDTGFVTSLCFEQEPELNEGVSSSDLSQFPLEDVLDQFNVFVSDFYNDKNHSDCKTCCLEFCGNRIEYVRQLRSIIGKHVYNHVCEKAITLVIE